MNLSSKISDNISRRNSLIAYINNSNSSYKRDTNSIGLKALSLFLDLGRKASDNGGQ